MIRNPVQYFIDTARLAGLPVVAKPSGDGAFVRRLFGPDMAAFVDAVGYPGDTEVPWIAEDLLLYPLDDIETRQAGYRFDAVTGAVDPRWNPDHWVIADWTGDPFTIGADGAIYYARHGMGTWEHRRICADLAAFLDLLSAWNVFYVIDNDQSIHDDEFAILPEKRAQFVEALAREGEAVDAPAVLSAFLAD